MNQNKLNFESESLTVHFITINISGPVDVDPIAKYLFKHCHFNSVLEGTGRKKFLYSKSTNPYKVSFRPTEYNPSEKLFWSGTQVIFSGDNAAQLYKLIKAQKFQWDILNLEKVNIGRFDIHYFRKSNSVDSNQRVKDFLESSFDSIRAKSKRRKVSFDPTREPYILKVGSRSSSNYSRVYQKTKEINHGVYIESTEGLQFELEIKKGFIKSFQQFLFNNRIDEFEERLTQHFFKQSRQNFGLHFSYTDWIRDFYRKLSYTREFNTGLVTDYLGKSKLNSFTDKESLFRLLQFLSFIRNLKGVKQFVDDQIYYLIEFPVADFLRFLGENPKSSYQRKKVLDFLNSLQGFPPLVEQFSEVEFRSSVMFPLVKLRKESRSWILKIAIGEQLYSYTYPFVFSDSLVYFQTKYDLIVKLEIIQVLSTNSLAKKFPVENFINQFRKNNRTQIKKLIINLLDELKNSKLIESDFNIVLKKGSSKRVENLTPLLITQSKDILFYEIIDC